MISPPSSFSGSIVQFCMQMIAPSPVSPGVSSDVHLHLATTQRPWLNAGCDPGSWCLLDLHSIRRLDWIHLPRAPIHPGKPLLWPSVGDRLGPLSEAWCDEQSKYTHAQWFLHHPNLILCDAFIFTLLLHCESMSLICLWQSTVGYSCGMNAVHK